MKDFEKNLLEPNDMYQLVIPMLVDSELEINYDSILRKKRFEKFEYTDVTSDLLYFDVVPDTFKKGFTHYKFDNCSKFRFKLNLNNNEFLNFGVKSISFYIKQNEIKSCLDKEIVYFTLLLEDDCEMGKKHDQEVVMSLLSQYQSQHFRSKTTSSYLVNDQKQICMFHGNRKENILLENRFEIMYNFFEVEAYKKSSNNIANMKDGEEGYKDVLATHKAKYKSAINFVYGKNIFINFYINDNKYFERITNAIENKEEQSSCDLISSIYETKFESKIYLDNIDQIILDSFYLKWIKTGCVNVTTTNSFGVICNEKSTVKSSLVFQKYSLAIFISLNQRVLNILVQESVKGIKDNSVTHFNEHYSNLEKFSFYEISSEKQLQTLFEMMQNNFKNNELTSTIMSEMEIYQTQRLNDVFERLTNYGIYLSVLGLVIGVFSYFATFYSVANEYNKYYQLISKFFANPLYMLIFGIIFYLVTIAYLRKRK